jgi:hypothetical protein
MKTSLSKLVLLLIFTVMAFSAGALVSEYSFAGTQGTYTEITGGTVLGSTANDDESFNAIPLGFTFTYNGVDYTQISVQTDAFIAFGPEVANNTLAISSATGTNNIVAALNRDLKSRDNGELSYLLTGTEPNRVFIVQWKNYRRIPTSAANDVFNFQIQIQENGDKVVFAYGAFTVVNVTTAQTVQVGLRGDSNADYNNRTTTTDWTATTAGTANNASCRISDTVFPPNGLIFTYTPPQTGTPPNPAQNPVPANNAVNVAIGANLTWVTGGGTVEGYRVFFGTDNPPTNLVNGTVQTGTVYDHPTDLSYSTAYYWKIVPFNAAGGDAVDCPVWQFTTLADPTVTTYPYNQNFDEATPPALPLGWSAINANGDAYTWETYAGNADTAPNSARIRYNTSMAMDDWMLTPPMTMTADNTYLIKFMYRANSTTYAEALSVYTGTAPNAASLTNLIYENLNITNTTYAQAEVTFTPTAAGNYYIGFHGHSAADMFYLYLDTFSVEVNNDSMDPPTNLTATVVNNTYVSLDWDAPGVVPPVGEWIHYDSGLNDDSIGTGAAADFDVAIRYPASALTQYAGQSLYAVKAWPAQAGSFSIRVWTGGTPAAPAQMVVDQAFTPTLDTYNTVMLTNPVTVTGNEELWFGYRCNVTSGYPAGCDAGPATDGFGNMMYFQGAWATLLDLAPTLNYNWNIQGYVGNTPPTAAPVLTYIEDAATIPAKAVSMNGILGKRGIGPRHLTVIDNQDRDRELLGYKVYRDGALLTTINDAATTAYDDMAVTVGTYSYTVTANYTAGESVPAGPVTATINPPNNPPTDLTATVEGNDVTLNWVSPEAPPTGEWITWCTDVLGNGIGTNSAIVFDVAHRFDQTDLASHQGDIVSQVKFVPNYADCVYTVKVWTGGSATSAGTLVSSQVVSNITVGDWNLCVLNTPVPIPSTGDLYVGYEVNTQGDHPAGCDDGPQIEGKGNMMYFEGAWTTLTQLAPTLTYNWSIKTFVADGTAMKAVELTPITENRTISYAKAPLEVLYKAPNREDGRPLTSFKVYRDNVLIGTINDPAVTTYTDIDLPNGNYVYGVTAVYNTGESAPATVNVTVNVQLAEIIFEDGFETYDDFTMVFAPWTLVDVDQAPTYGFSGITFPGSESPMAYIIFNPASTTPPITGLNPHGGAKMAASFAATTPPNNDWMVTPRLHLGTNSTIKFYAKSHTAQYGLERFKVGVSTLPSIIPQGFQYVSPGDYVEAPVNWAEYVYDLSTYNNQNVWIGIRCVSNDAFVFYVDDVSVHSDGGYVVDNDDPGVPAAVTELQGNFPNPFNPETTIRYSVKDASPVNIGIYNVKGQLVKTLVNEEKASGNHGIVWDGRDNNNHAVSSGVYFYKMTAGKYSSTKKMIMMK